MRRTRRWGAGILVAALAVGTPALATPAPSKKQSTPKPVGIPRTPDRLPAVYLSLSLSSLKVSTLPTTTPAAPRSVK